MGRIVSSLTPSFPASRPRAILLTGTPGTGKTTLAKAWCKKRGWAYLALNDLVVEKRLYSRIDAADGSKVVRLSALAREANRRIARLSRPPRSIGHPMVIPVLVEGHLGCEIPLEVSRILVLRLHPALLTRRLRSRAYPTFKLEDNRLAEMLDYCTLRAQQIYGKRRVFEMDTSGRSISKNMLRLGRFLSGSTPTRGFLATVAWRKELEKEVMGD